MKEGNALAKHCQSMLVVRRGRTQRAGRSLLSPLLERGDEGLDPGEIGRSMQTHRVTFRVATLDEGERRLSADSPLLKRQVKTSQQGKRRLHRGMALTRTFSSRCRFCEG